MSEGPTRHEGAPKKVSITFDINRPVYGIKPAPWDEFFKFDSNREAEIARKKGIRVLLFFGVADALKKSGAEKVSVYLQPSIIEEISVAAEEAKKLGGTVRINVRESDYEVDYSKDKWEKWTIENGSIVRHSALGRTEKQAIDQWSPSDYSSDVFAKNSQIDSPIFMSPEEARINGCPEGVIQEAERNAKKAAEAQAVTAQERAIEAAEFRKQSDEQREKAMQEKELILAAVRDALETDDDDGVRYDGGRLNGMSVSFYNDKYTVRSWSGSDDRDSEYDNLDELFEDHWDELSNWYHEREAGEK